MEKYISAFNEIDLLMEGLFERLNIGIGEINAYPSEDMFRIIVNKTEVESLKSINEMFAKNYRLRQVNTRAIMWAQHLLQ